MKCNNCDEKAVGYVIKNSKIWYCLLCYEEIGKYPEKIILGRKVFYSDYTTIDKLNNNMLY